MDKTVRDIISDFESFSVWEDKYRFIIELGEELEGLSNELKVDKNLIRGCQSKVWLVCHYDKN